MEGYVTVPNSNYVQTIQLVDSAANAMTALKNRNYYSFGIEPRPLNDRSNFLKAQLPGFYQLTDKNFEDTRIDTAINAAITGQKNKDKISILITDLYQQESDIAKVTDQLKQYLEGDYAVGILAIRSQFQGWIYDVGIAGGKFRYDTTKVKPEQYRPFYLIILGKYPDVVNYFEQLKNLDKNLFTEEQFMIFYHQIVSQPSLLSISSNSPRRGNGLLRQKTMWVTGNQRKNRIKVDPETVELLGVDERLENSNKNSIDNQASYYPLPYTLPLASEGNIFTLDPIVEIFDKSQNDFTPVKSVNLTADIFAITILNKEANMMNMTSEIDAKKLESGTYFIQANLIPYQFQEPNWWTTWNTEASNQDGSKTNKLKNFLSELKAVMLKAMESKQTRVGKLCYVIQKN